MRRRIAALLLLSVGIAATAAPAVGAAAQPAVKSPNDPFFRHQWQLRAIGIPAAWAISRGAGVTVAVLDTGVAFEDRGRYRQAPDLAGTRFVKGWDFVDGDAHPNDVPPRDGRRSHGTLMAGLIAQTADNRLGGAGVAPEAAIMPVRVLRPDLSGSPGAIARGVRFAVDHGADVINLSIAGPKPSRALTAAIEHAAARDVIVVAASGNDGAAQVSVPAADPSVIAVGAVRRDLTRAAYSNYGSALDLVAPAGAGERFDDGRGPSDGVFAQTLRGGPASFCYCFTASTSAAAAQVSGVAALLVASGTATGPAAIRAALLARARDLGPPGRDDEYGAGLVQAGSAPAARPEATARPAARGRESDRSSGAWRVFAIAGVVAVVLAAFFLMPRRRRARSG
jgi:serine protease